MSVTKWVLIDETNGAKTGDGSSLDAATLQRIVSTCDAQLNTEFADEYGGQYQVRMGKDATDIQPGEQVYSFVPTLAQAPGASAYHDIDGKGVPVAYCAVTTCSSLLGPSGISVDASHELLEAAADPSCNMMADNLAGLLVAYEVGDPVETQTYASHVDEEVQLSNFVLKSWFDPKASAPYDFMSYADIPGAVAPPGPLQIAPGNGGNYIITETSTENSTDTFGIQGTQRKARKDTGSRFMRRLMSRQVSMKGRMAIAGMTPKPMLKDPPQAPRVLPRSLQGAAPQAHTPPGTVEHVAAHKTPPAMRPPGRPLPRSLQVAAAIASTLPTAPDMNPTGISAAGMDRAKLFASRVDARGARSMGSAQHDPQQAVLAGRKIIRDSQKDEK